MAHDEFMTFDDRYMFLLNALPALTFEELHKRAQVPLRNRKQGQRQVFDLDIQWGGGEDFKSHTLRSGQQMRQPEKRAREIAEAYRPSGNICSTAPGLAMYREEEDKHDAIVNALQIAEQHYHTLGAGQIDGVRQALGHRDEEVTKTYRGSVYGSYFLAMAKEEAIREHRELLEMEHATAPRKIA